MFEKIIRKSKKFCEIIQFFKNLSKFFDFFQALKSDLLLSVPTYKAKLRAFYHAWNPLDSSRHIYIKPNAFTLHRNPVAQSTDGARAKIGFEAGRHVWEIMWEGPLGTVAIVGISTKDAILQCHG